MPEISYPMGVGTGKMATVDLPRRYAGCPLLGQFQIMFFLHYRLRPDLIQGSVGFLWLRGKPKGDNSSRGQMNKSE